MKINLKKPKKVIIQEEKSKQVTELTASRLIDFPQLKIVRCLISELNEDIVLWEGESYDAIGQWTDDDVINRLNELYNI